MAKKKFYAVKVGLTPGIYETWAECEANVKGYPKADYKGFTTLAEAQYYMNEGGTMLTGWVKVKDTWYYMNSSGAMETGWVYLDGYWYYFNDSGAMETGWIYTGGYWYYLYSDGKMAADTYVDIYYVDPSGAWVE